MPAGVAVLDRLGLRGAVGGRPLASVRYHGFGLSAEAGFPVGRGWDGALRARATAPASGPGAARGGARDAGRTRVRRGARSKAPRSRGDARSASTSAASCAAGDWWSARTASTRPCAARWGSIAARDQVKPGASACACTSARGRPGGAVAPGDLHRPRLRAVRGAAARRRAAARGARRSRCPRVERARRDRALDRRASRCCADWLDGATPLTEAGGPGARHPPRARRVRAGRRAAGRRRARHRPADRRRHRARAGHRRAAGGDRSPRAGRGRCGARPLRSRAPPAAARARLADARAGVPGRPPRPRARRRCWACGRRRA